MRRISLSIESRLDAVGLLRRLINSACVFAGLSAIDSSLVEVSVVEAVNNAIEHAYSGNSEQKVEVVISLVADELVFEVIDSGKSADPTFIHSDHRKALDIDEDNLGDASERGRGLAIIQQVMDSAEYSPGVQRNVFRLTKHLNRSSALPSTVAEDKPDFG